MKRLSQPFWLCSIAATIALCFRIGLYDWQFLFLQKFPNHDIAQGAGFFAIDLHSLRISGDIAWWKSNSQNGYAHYYQTFLSPLAPTTSHITFWATALVMGVLDTVHLRISEYLYYVIVTYVLLPWLTFAGFGWLTYQFAPDPRAVVFAVVTYALSTIGLWNGAWFYFQEFATLNFLLASLIALMQSNTALRLRLFLLAALIQCASVNYWTVYNFFFFVVFIGGYACFFPDRARCALKALTAARRLSVPVVVVCVLWLGFLSLIAIEQSGSNIRTSIRQHGYTATQVVARVGSGYSLQRATTAFVDRQQYAPFVDRNPMHSARYVGGVTVVLALAGLLLARRRETLFLAGATLAVFAITFAPSPLIWLWERLPMMNSILHQFYFYPHFVAQLLVLMGAVGLNELRRFRAGHLLATAALVIAITDLGFYYRAVVGVDDRFTRNVIWPTMGDLTPEKHRTLLRPLPELDPAAGFEGGVATALPIIVAVFPNNRFVVPKAFLETMRDPVATAKLSRTPDLQFETHDNIITAVPLAEEWTYNRFRFSIDAPSDGHLLVRQMPDRFWRINVDGRPASFATAYGDTGLSIALTAGRHRIEMDYQPTTRLLYWPLTLLFVLTCCWIVGSEKIIYIGNLVWRARVPATVPKT